METLEDQRTGWAQAGTQSDFERWLGERKVVVSRLSETKMGSLKNE